MHTGALLHACRADAMMLHCTPSHTLCRLRHVHSPSVRHLLSSTIDCWSVGCAAPAQKVLGKGPFGVGGYGQSVERGAIPIIFAATSDEMSGAVLVGRFVSTIGRPTRTPPASAVTCAMCGRGCLTAVKLRHELWLTD